MKKKLKYIESIRGIACLIVLFAHIASIHPQFGIYASGCGKIGVWCFMVLSGMLLILPYIEDISKEFSFKELPEYYIKKILRIYPSYLIAICIGYILDFISITDIPKHILLINGWGHFWYMPVIIKFYIIAPFFLIVFSKIKKHIPKQAITIYTIILAVICISFSLIFPYNTYIENSTALYWYLPVFIIGMLLAFVLSLAKSVRISTKLMDILSIIVPIFIILPTALFRELLWGIDPSNYLQNKYLYMAICWCAIILAISHSTIIKKFFENATLLHKIGAISYDIYLIHYLILNKSLQICSSFLLQATITIIFSFLFAICLYFIRTYLKKHISIKIQYTIMIMFTLILIIVPFIINKMSNTSISKSVENEDISVKSQSETNISWSNRLYVPTMINKINNTYFIIDCWHHRVLYSDSLNEDLLTWHTLTDSDYIAGHTICSDGELLVLDNTDGSSILVYKNTAEAGDNQYELIQTISNITGRPHYVTYDSNNKYFYIIASTEGTIHVFKNNGGYLELVRSDILNEIYGSYVRSISIIDNYLYTVSGPNCIYKYAINQDHFELIESYPVPAELSGMNQITKIDDYFYITVNTGATGSVDETTIVRTKDLSSLQNNDYEDLYNIMGFVGQPYFITHFDNAYYITEISENRGNGIKKFSIDNNEITNIETLYYWENVLDSSKQRYVEFSNTAEANEKVDLFLFAGQSNMSGKGNATEAPIVLKGYEFRSISDPTTLYPISEPFGVMENKENGINDTWENMTILRKTGSIVSAFANTYYAYTGKPIVGVSCSEGATTVSQWLPDTEKYKDLLERAQTAKNYLIQSEHYSLQNTYLVWCQGESDGDAGTSYDDYYNSLSSITNTLVENNIVDHCFIIAIGENGSNSKLYETIHSAQIQLCKDNPNCTLVSDSFLGMKEQGLMIDDYHYSQKGYNIVGEEAGKNAALHSFQLQK